MTNTVNTRNHQYNNVKVTPDQQKKHVKQMTMQELQYLQDKLNALNTAKTAFSNHFFDKGLDVTDLQVINILQKKNYEVIEYNETPMRFDDRLDRRVLIRTNIVNTRHLALCIVVSLTTNTIVTGYYNETTDNHQSLNWSRYNKALVIVR
jgi:hypothetical protein